MQRILHTGTLIHTAKSCSPGGSGDAMRYSFSHFLAQKLGNQSAFLTIVSFNTGDNVTSEEVSMGTCGHILSVKLQHCFTHQQGAFTDLHFPKLRFSLWQ